MRPRGQTPRMPSAEEKVRFYPVGFNEAAGADPADAPAGRSESREAARCFNEAAGADPADAPGAGRIWWRCNWLQ